ncbi:helix-turn-helix domain-containing protein [Streptococcus panodentis]|uniref:Transcriptional regulator n=1 Tax=Streptococcus panodentis TaxID=1581472 RepID=A0ABS5AUV2_9STRE|nr:helix-turn-helix transcriptional regulator [Streptococcus panodentis]MBP2620345.1 transcriptional regulator [Streptococcus panodentis]
MFPERLKKLRKEAGLTQKQIAEKFGIKQPNYQQWESGKRKPSGETLEKFADFFSVSTDYLLGNTDNKVPTSASLQSAEVMFRKTVDDFNLTKEQQEQFKKDIDNFIEARRRAFEENQD